MDQTFHPYIFLGVQQSKEVKITSIFIKINKILPFILPLQFRI